MAISPIGVSNEMAEYYRMRTENGFAGQTASVAQAGSAENRSIQNLEEVRRPSGIEAQKGLGRCETCENRKYQDESNDPGVSMKSATALNPSEAALKVSAHEQEHVSRERNKASSEGREVVSQHVQIHTGVCPECGKTYVSGGTTSTTTRNKTPLNIEPLGQNIDIQI